MVGEVALLALVRARAEVPDEVLRRDDRLRLEGDRRSDDAHECPERLQQLMDLGLVLAVVPMRFHRNGTASSRSTSTPAAASPSIASAITRNTSGFA